jgi:Tol biopolymer transport system component
MQYSRIWAMNAEGSNLIQLTNDLAYNCTWSRDGSKTVYNDSRGSNGRLWIMNADGSDKSQLTFLSRF